MRIYIENTSSTTIGGGFSFLRNLKKGVPLEVEFVDRVEDCDIFFIFSVSAVDKGNVYKAKQLGKKIILRCDNIPRKSRNRRQSPAERLREFGEISSVVIYQSKWAKEYAGYFAGEGIVINNGVDVSIFNQIGRESDDKTCLYLNYNDNPNKRFDEVIYRFEMAWRKDNKLHLVLAGNVSSIYLEHPEYNWDLNVPAKVEYIGVLKTPQEVADLMRKCDFLIYPSFAEAYPNVLLEAMACGMMPMYINETGGAIEVIQNNNEKIFTIEDMGKAYYKVFKQLMLK